MSFTAPFLLAALGAIAVPVILHLMSKDVPTTVKFSSLRFITSDKLETQSKKGIKDLLLLLFRCLIIAALVFAFSKPFVPLVSTKDSKLETVVIVDNSASMNRPGFGEFLKEALDKNISDEESVALIISGNGPEGKAEFNPKNIILSKASEISGSLKHGQHEDSVKAALEMFSPNASAKKLIIVSDFQPGDWNISKSLGIDKSIELKFVNPFNTPRNNFSVSVDRVRRLNNGEIVQVQVLVQNFSTSELKASLKLVSGQKVVESSCQVASRSSEKKVLTIEKPESSIASVVLENKDDFIEDNEFFIWIGESAPINVAFPESSDRESLDYIFIKKALQEVKAGDASFRVTSVDANIFSPDDLSEYQAVVLTDSAHALQQDVFESLKTYVENGGLLIVAPSERAGMLFSRVKAYGLADVAFEEVVKRKSSIDLPFSFADMSENSEVTKVFANTPDTDLLSFPIYSYNKLKVGANGKNLLSFKNDEPGISLFNLGKGNVVVSAIPFNHVWSDFTISNSFLPFIRLMIVSQTGVEDYSVKKLVVGEQKLISNSFDEYFDTTKAGVVVVDEVPVQVNVSREESTAENLNLIDFKAQLRKSTGEQIVTTNHDDSKIGYWHYFFLLAVLALVSEFLITDLKPAKNNA
ncbi:MAG: BatA domain-containing protein [Lentisphaeraceae bacterium]|nr:BatA domain-containing protein [Lentisphaeraceae bacterium]